MQPMFHQLQLHKDKTNLINKPDKKKLNASQECNNLHINTNKRTICVCFCLCKKQKHLLKSLKCILHVSQSQIIQCGLIFQKCQSNLGVRSKVIITHERKDETVCYSKRCFCIHCFSPFTYPKNIILNLASRMSFYEVYFDRDFVKNVFSLQHSVGVQP